METKAESGLLYKFAVIFAAFTAVTFLMCCTHIYFRELEAYRRQCEEKAGNIALCLEEFVAADGENFLQYQEVFLKRRKDMRIRYDFSDWRAEKEKFDRLFAQKYPGKVMGRDVRALALDDETQMAYAAYMHAYWLSVFARTRDSFGVVDAYYVVPTGEPLHIYRTLGAVRKKEETEGAAFVGLADDVYAPLEGRQTMWEAWNTGKKPQGHDEYDTAYGKVCACYTPVFVNGRKIGLIGTELSVEAGSREILKRAIRQTAILGLIFAVCAAALLIFLWKRSLLRGRLVPAACVAALLWFVHQRYVAKSARPQTDGCDSAEEQETIVAETSERDAERGDGLAALPMQAAAMIMEMEPYLKSFVDTTKRLGEAWANADAVRALTDEDASTGVRDKAAYDEEIRRLEGELAQDSGKRFGFAMISLNHCQRINDAFGYEQGNIAIQRLGHIVCEMFERSPVFRIGGDAFAVVLENEDDAHVDALAAELGRKLDEMAQDEALESWERISAAVGVACYDPAADSSVADVCRRADRAMVQRKQEMQTAWIE